MIKFIKENKVAVLSIFAIALCLVLLALPGQFAHNQLLGDRYKYTFSGYEFLFNLKYTQGIDSTTHVGSGVIASGVTAIVLFGLAVASFCLSKISSFFVLLGGVFNLISSILFFSMEAAGRGVYKVYDEGVLCIWANYVVAAILLLAAAYAIFVAIKMMKNEIKRPSQAKASYSYLKK